MQQTPVHHRHNSQLLALIPPASIRIVEVGCSSGALARVWRDAHPQCNYLGIEIDPAYAVMAARHCTASLILDIEQAPESFWQDNTDRDCWIFGDTLEHLRDPWRVLRQVRAVLPAHGAVVACIPNAQHWSLQANLAIGNFRYQKDGLLDRTHLRWFTGKTIAELFTQAGFEVTVKKPRIVKPQDADPYLPAIEAMARAAGADPKAAVEASLPIQYLVKAVPAQR